ncbi:MAG: AraC family transcriptional regulator [Clostridia bacterium]|nr:AraC family transcriptional regulator [Clostridia bacterium]
MKQGRVFDWMNAASDDVFFDMPMNHSLMKQHFLNPIMAGITKPNPDYSVDRRRGGLAGLYKNLYVIEYVTKGAGYIEYRDIKKRVKKGDLYILNRGISAYYYSDKDDPYEKKWLNVLGNFFGELLAAVNITDPVFVISMNAEPYMDELLDVLKKADDHPTDDDVKKVAHVLSDLFYEINKQKTDVQKRSHQVSAEQIGNYITGHITTAPLIVSDIADRFGISERHLNRLFKQRYDCSPVVFITKRKIEYAEQLLIEGRYSVEEIAAILHYTGVDYFRKVFVAERGMSPMKWKAAFKTGNITR